MKCPQCGEVNPPDVVECSRCKGPLLDALAETDQTARGGAPATLSGLAPTAPAEIPGHTGPLSQVTGSIYGLADQVPSSGTTAGGTTGAIPLQTVFANRYEILTLLGQGGMGRVYAARDREVDRVIALKTVTSDPGDTLAVQRFKHELILARKVTHKNVVRIYDLGEADGIKFFTMEHIEGDSLKGLIRNRGRLPAPEAVPLARQILAGLQEAHEQGVIHRDLKPQNVMVDKQGNPHLMDFGIARSADMTGVTGTGMLVGTPDYMSPEQVKGEKADVRSDIFSFGVILYEMVTGELPYQGDSPVSKIVMRLSQKPRAPREVSADIPDYLERVILKCMEVDPALRYQGVPEILADFDRQQVDRGLTVRAQRAFGRNKALALGATAALVLVALGLWLRGRAPGGAAPSIPAGPILSLAIVPFTNAAGKADLEWLRTGLPEMLATDLSQSRYIRPVPGERVFRVLKDSGLSQQARFDERALESVAKGTQAQSILTGQFVESEGRLRLDLWLRKSGSGVPVPIKAEGPQAQVLVLVDDVTRRVKELLDLSPEQIQGDSAHPIAEVTTASLEAQRAYQEGLAQLRRGANQDAVPLFQKATARDGNFAMAWAKLAEAHLGASQFDDAGPAVERARTLSEKAPLPVAVRYQIHATAAMVKEDYETAAKSYLELAKLFPSDPDVQMSLARAQELGGKLSEALASYKHALELAPQFGAAMLGMGRTQVLTGKPKEAIRSLNEALATKQFEGEPEALGMIYSILGVAYRDTAELDKAIEAFNHSLDERTRAGDKRGQAVTLYNLASVYEFRGEVDKALAAERKALAMAREIKDRAEESAALNNIGLTLKAAGQLDKALAAFRESFQIEMERQNHRALANRLDAIANVYQLKGQYDDAIVYLEQAKSHVAQSGEKEDKAINLNYIAQVRKAQGYYDQAVEAYLASLPIFKEIGQDMGVAMTHHDLGEIYAAQGRYADALGAIQQSLDIYKQLGIVHDMAEARAPLGHLLATMGLVDQAAKELEEAQRLATEAKAGEIVPEILLGRAEVASLKGHHDEAARLYEEANVKANLSGQKEVAVESRIELGRLYLEQGKLPAAERLLARTRDEAAQARLRPLEAEAGVALAEALLAKGDAEGARKTALAAAAIADKLSLRPVTFEAEALRGRALNKLGRMDEALDAFAKAAATLEWMRGSVKPEHVASFMARPAAQAFLKDALPRLEAGGRAAEAAPLKKWAAPRPGA